MSTITISDQFYQLLERRANMTGCSPEEVIEYMIWQHLSPPSHPKVPKNRISEPDSNYAAEVATYIRNAALFEQLLPELLQEHNGECVAIRNEQVVGFNTDWEELQREILEKHGPGGGLFIITVSKFSRLLLDRVLNRVR